MKIQPQPGFQTRFLTCSADIAIGGGSAGCSKTFSILMDALRYYNIQTFKPVYFRREMTDIKMPALS